jgi:carbon-monoxide dehydrogenase medium subunit
MKPAPFELIACRSTAEAMAMLAAGDGTAKAASGTQSLGPMLNLRLVEVERLLDLSRIESLRGFELDGGILRIGAGVTHARIEDGALPDVSAGLLPSVASGIAFRAVRNRGTIGGSLAHADPAADWVTTMCLLDARLVVLSPSRERRARAADFFAGPFTTTLGADELLVAVEVARCSPAARWAYRKFCRKPGEFAEAIAAVLVDAPCGVARVCLGALDRMPVVVDGLANIEALREPAAVDRLLDGSGVDDEYQRQLQRTMLKRAFADIDRNRAP